MKDAFLLGLYASMGKMLIVGLVFGIPALLTALRSRYTNRSARPVRNRLKLLARQRG